MNTREMESPNPETGLCDRYHTITNNGKYCCGNSEGYTKIGICNHTNDATSSDKCGNPGLLQTLCNTKSNTNNSKQVRIFIGVL